MTSRTLEPAQYTAARVAGFIYLFTTVTANFAEFYYSVQMGFACRRRLPVCALGRGSEHASAVMALLDSVLPWRDPTTTPQTALSCLDMKTVMELCSSPIDQLEQLALISQGESEEDNE